MRDKLADDTAERPYFTHHFVGGVTFNKGGAEILKVTQANNAKVFGKATFAIA